jgi:methyl halide transferase
MTMIPDRQYWESRYSNSQTGWDIGYISKPLKEYFDQLNNKEIKILIPGSGKGWEAEYLFSAGFKNVYVLDYSENAINEFITRCPEFPSGQIVIDDFFNHEGNYDLIVEQTFFSSLSPHIRNRYVHKIHSLLSDNGKLVGLLFNHEFDFAGPPFGGTKKEYQQIFESYFKYLIFEIARNSIGPRKGRELFLLFQRIGG